MSIQVSEIRIGWLGILARETRNRVNSTIVIPAYFVSGILLDFSIPARSALNIPLALRRS